MNLKEILKSNKLLYYFIKKIRIFQFDIFPIIMFKVIFNVKRFLRVMRFKRNTRYEKLKTIKNKHKGERCFIVATGPSLTIEDLEKLRDEVTISMNSICLAFEETEWRPTYYGIQDLGVYNKFEKDIEKLDAECKFVSDIIANYKNISDDHYIFPLNLLNHFMVHKKYNTKFSDDAFSVVYDGYTITYSLIQIAVYMGFKDIYLLGTDCNYSSNMNHHFKDYNHVDPSFLLAGNKMTAAYTEAKKFANKNKIKIYNATRGGMLEVFERVNLDKVLSTQNENMASLKRQTV